jgi:hypothetical protein
MTTTPRGLALGAKALLLSLLIAATALGGPDGEQAKARKDLKKNAKHLLQADAALTKAQDDLARILGAPKLDEARQHATEEQINQLRDVAGGIADEIQKADDDDAAQVLVQVGVLTQSEELYGRVLDDLKRLTTDEAIGWMASTLGAGVTEDGGRGRRSSGHGRADEAWKAQVLIARAFEAIDKEATVPPIVGQLERGTQPEVVNACVATAARKQDKRVIPALISFLGRVEKQGGWEYKQVRQALVDLTGQDFFTQERWQGWWGTAEASWDFSHKGEAHEAATRERGPQEKVPTFFGSEVTSNRVCFIIDTSGSMQMTDRPAENTMSEEDFAKADPDSPEIKPLKRIERAKKNLADCIKALQPTQKFNIIAFSDNNRMWKQAIVDATEQNKADALHFVEGLREDGGTNTYSALEQAFRDPQIDTIYLMSDGAPMVKLGNPGEQMKQFARDEVRRVLELVRRENRFRGLRVYTFGMDGPGVWHVKWGLPRPVTLPTDADWLSILSGFMRELASATGGEYKSI